MALNKQQALGQYETPADVADLLLGFCWAAMKGRALDPSCGGGVILARAAMRAWRGGPGADRAEGTLFGIELDPQAAAEARRRVPQATIHCADFLTVPPGPDTLFDAIIGNPPYTRAEWLPPHTPASPLLTPAQRLAIGGRAGLHAHFLVHSASFLAPAGRLGFVMPNSWLDVAYGAPLKQFILDHFKLLAIVESTAERWFGQARVNTCLLLLEQCDQPAARAANPARLILLRRPLAALLSGLDYFASVQRLVEGLLGAEPEVSQEWDRRVVAQCDLEPADRWGRALRGSPIGQRRRRAPAIAPVGAWASVRRGYTTGANSFFYLPPARVRQWAIEPEYRRPLLKTLRGYRRLRVAAADCQAELLAIRPEARLSAQGAGGYVAWGESQGIHHRHTCRARLPWYCLAGQPPADLLIPKGIWMHHFAPLVAGPLVVDQQLYCLRLADKATSLVAAALLNSSWLALQLELQGRVNFGHGVLWLATYELEQIPLPDPRRLPARLQEALAAAFLALAGRSIGPTEAELQLADRQALDALVAEAVGLAPAAERQVALALVERLAARQRLARSVAGKE
jgi:tRNA1(Val) A37 N6-methylase TrmN6